VKLHLDTDLGGDIDDLCALAMLLNWPGVDLVGVTTNADDEGRRAGYVRYALSLVGRQDVPVAAGADISLGGYRVTPGLPDEAAYWPEPIPPAPTPLDEALTLLEQSIEQGATIVAIGMYTNLALLEQRSPGILGRAELYLMGGYVYPPRQGYPQWGLNMDWNVQLDVNSAHTVLQRSRPTLVPLSVTVETALRRAHLPSLEQGGPLARLIARQAEAFARDEQNEERFGRTCAGLPEDTINFLHDPLACAIALAWREGIVIRELPLQMALEDGWLHQRVAADGKPTRVVTQVDGGRFSDFWLRMVVDPPVSHV
jgi:purine nucleosidase